MTPLVPRFTMDVERKIYGNLVCTDRAMIFEHGTLRRIEHFLTLHEALAFDAKMRRLDGTIDEARMIIFLEAA